MSISPWVVGILVILNIVFFLAWIFKPTHKARAEGLQNKLAKAEQGEIDAEATVTQLKAAIERRDKDFDTVVASHENDIQGTTAKIDQLSSITAEQGERIEDLVSENKMLIGKNQKLTTKPLSDVGVTRLEIMDKRWAVTSKHWRQLIDRKVRKASK